MTSLNWTTWSAIVYWFVLMSLGAHMLALPEHNLLHANPGTIHIVCNLYII